MPSFSCSQNSYNNYNISPVEINLGGAEQLLAGRIYNIPQLSCETVRAVVLLIEHQQHGLAAFRII